MTASTIASGSSESAAGTAPAAIPAEQDRALHAKRQAQTGLAAVLALLVALVAVAFYAADRLYTTGEETYTAEAAPLRAVSRDLSFQLANEDSAVRAYITTAATANLEPFASAQGSASNDLASLVAAEQTHPELKKEISDVHDKGSALASFFNSQVALVRRNAKNHAQAYHNLLAEDALFDHLRLANTALGNHISQIVAQEHVKQRRTYVRTETFLIVAGSLAAAIGLGLLYFLPRRLERLYRQELDARERAELGANAAQALAHVGEAVVLLDDHDRVRYWNHGAEPLVGRANGNVLGQPAAGVITEFATVKEAAGETDATVVPLMVEDEERWYAVSQTEFPEGRVLVLRDVTDAHALEQARTDFVATAAHELRTPITAIFGAAQTLRREDIELTAETKQSLLEIVESESERLARLVEQILTTAQLDRGEELLATDHCDLRAVCESVFRAHELTKPDSIMLVLDAPQTMKPVDCDAERIRQVISNLVGNAVKYSPAGGTISLQLTDGPKHVRIDVRDEGIGIPPSAQARIFDKFSRLDPALTRGIGGSGLGLYISRGLVEQMGGKISVVSRPDAGSTFTVELPRYR
ncbi:MAG TPA: ATP-binding protein [Gaiellaceae bacterium]|nr:ATP-binding protein [Gaiellaceae bacterium]